MHYAFEWHNKEWEESLHAYNVINNNWMEIVCILSLPLVQMNVLPEQWNEDKEMLMVDGKLEKEIEEKKNVLFFIIETFCVISA